MTATPSANGTHHRNGKASTPSTGRLKNGANGKPAADRDAATGQFLKGNKGGPGRPRNPWTRILVRRRAVLLATIDDDHFAGLIKRLWDNAMGGDMAAARLILEFCCGKPTAAPDMDGLDQDEWDRLTRQPTATEVMRAAEDGCDPTVAVPYVLASGPKTVRALKKEQAGLVENSENDGHGPIVLQDLRAEQKARAQAAGRKGGR
jgi:hypothetical protein